MILYPNTKVIHTRSTVLTNQNVTYDHHLEIRSQSNVIRPLQVGHGGGGDGLAGDYHMQAKFEVKQPPPPDLMIYAREGPA